MKFSLIMATYSRDEVLHGFLKRLAEQTYRDFELIVVDQNVHFRVKQICDHYLSNFDIRYMRTDTIGLSHARNIGLKHITGDIISFPDDDCEYPPDLLSKVNHFFANNPEYNILTGTAIDTATSKRFGWFLPEPCTLTGVNIMRACTSFSIFIKTKDNLVNFDEQFGVGARFGSAEEVDYIFRLLRAGFKGYYNPQLEVYHPERNLNNMSLNTLYDYSSGIGAYLKKCMFFGRNWKLFGVCLNLLFIRPVGGMLFSLLKLNWPEFVWYRTSLEGRIKGFIKYNRNCYAVSKTFERSGG